MLALQLTVNRGPIGLGATAVPLLLSGCSEELPFEHRVGHVGWQRPAETGGSEPLQRQPNRRRRHANTAGDLVAGHTGGIQPKHVAHLAHRDPLCWHRPLQWQKPKERTLSGPAETPSNRATSSRNAERNHLGTASDIKIGMVREIIPECRATSVGIRTRRGHRFCRYADDCNIYVRSRRAGERVMASVSRFLTKKLRLKVNETKSAVARPEERKFLGFSISNDGSERRIAPKALDKFKTQIRDMTRRTRGISLPQLIEELTPYLLGWRGYFGFCQTPRVLTNLEAWIRRRLRSYLWRQWQNGHNRFNELRRRGVPKFHAAVAAGSPTGFWRMSGHPAVQQALRNHYFDSLGLPRLHVPDQA